MHRVGIACLGIQHPALCTLGPLKHLFHFRILGTALRAFGRVHRLHAVSTLSYLAMVTHHTGSTLLFDVISLRELAAAPAICHASSDTMPLRAHALVQTRCSQHDANTFVLGSGPRPCLFFNGRQLLIRVRVWVHSVFQVLPMCRPD